MGRERCVVDPGVDVGRRTSWVGETRAWGGHGEGLRRSRGEAAGAESGSSSIERITVNTGTVPGFARGHVASVA